MQAHRSLTQTLGVRLMQRRNILKLWLLRAVLVGFAATLVPAYAQEQSVRPGVNKAYQNPEFDKWVARFERPGREVYDKRHKIVDAANIQPGMVVADIGAGTGLFTRLFSPRVGPTGHVIAADISEEFIHNTLVTAREQNLTNITGVVNTPTDAGLPQASIDLAFVCATYHHFEYPQRMLQSIHRALRSEAALIVIDFRKVEGLSSKWVMNHVRADKAIVIKEIEAQGFRLVKVSDLLQGSYFLRFEKATRE